MIDFLKAVLQSDICDRIANSSVLQQEIDIQPHPKRVRDMNNNVTRVVCCDCTIAADTIAPSAWDAKEKQNSLGFHAGGDGEGALEVVVGVSVELPCLVCM